MMAKQDSVSKVHLSSFDDLFQTDESREDLKRERLMEIPISLIHDFPDHPYKVKDDENMLELVESIKTRGLIQPVLVRPLDDGTYEMVSGHRRKRAFELANIEKIPARVVLCTLLSAIPYSAFALSWDGSSAGGSTNAVNGSSTGYVIRSTSDSACVVGYRFSAVKSDGSMKVTKVIDVYRNTSNGDNAYSTSAKFSTKYNKKQIITNKNAKLTTTYILAAADGVVVTATWHNSYGYYVKIKHDDTYSTLYAHCSALHVSVGQSVKQGQVIADCGSTGYSTGPHCHFEVIQNGVRVDALMFYKTN